MSNSFVQNGLFGYLWFMNYKHDREKVVAKGMDLFWRKGFHNLGVDEICRETGMTKGAFYNAFKNKESFLLTTLAYYGDTITSHLKVQLSNNDAKAFDKLITLYTTMLSVQPKNEFKGCLVNRMMSEMGAMNSSVAKLSATQFQRFIHAVEPTVMEAQQDGDFDSNVSTSQLTEIIHTAFFGFLTRAKSTNTSTHELMTLFLNTLKTKK